MSARENGMHSSISKADIQEAFLQGYRFEERLHRARKEAESVKRSIPWSEVTENDVLGGKGRRVRDHSANISFRASVKFHSEDYFRTPITEMIKSDHQLAIRLMIVDEVLSTGGRFLQPYLSGRNVYWKNMLLVDNKTLREKIQNRMKDCKESPPTVADIEGDIFTVSAIDGLDMNGFVDRDKHFLDTIAVNDANVMSDLNDADWDNDHHSTVADIVVDISPASAMVNLDRNRHLDQDKFVFDWSHMNEANWDDARPQTVADTKGNICCTSAINNRDRNSFLDQDKLSLDIFAVNETNVISDLNVADTDDDHPSTVADIVVDMSPTSAMINLDRNHHLDQDKLVLDWSHMNEAHWDDAPPPRP